MTYNRSHARRLLTASEYELFAESLSDRIGDLDVRQLKSRIDRTRKLRDKYRDLFRRQSLATRDRTGTKRGRSGQANERTDTKATIFTEALGRFESQLTKAEASAARAEARKKAEAARKATARRPKGSTTPKRTTASTKRAAAKKKRAPKGKDKKGFTSDSAVGGRNKARLDSPRNRKIGAHVGAAGRRNQARRDAR